LADTGGKSPHRGMVEPGPEQISFDPKTLERVARLDRDRRLVEHRAGVNRGRCVVDCHADRRLAGQDLPVADRSATAVLGNLPLMDVERAVFWSGDDGGTEDTASYDESEVRHQRSDERDALFALDIGHAIDPDSKPAFQRVVRLVDLDRRVRQ